MSYNVTGLAFAEKPSTGIEPTRLYDASRFKNHGTHTNITMVQLPSGLWVRDLNGSTSKITIPHNTSLDSTNALTIMVWIKISDTAGFNSILEKGKTPSPDFTGYFFYEAGNVLYFAISDGGVRDIFTAGAYTSTAWNLVTAVFDGDYMYVYVNGSLLGSKDTALTAIAPSTRDLKFGVRSYADTQYFGGLMALPKIPNYVLSPGQIKNVYERQLRDWFL